ncbi:hypothetical protein UFOVP124_55 [uncultured Caudovirales phage]|uniref:Uncharacterized protein n=1 Tax=uncultured Caudovirales phage TaxID=2100421 RepID=A0A6J5L9A2_9CAUD|nr:hypothetical protein UFOVP124_55 [uncultured Caudovirales phage]
MPDTFRFTPGCSCCGVECGILLGPFCDCCGLLPSGTLRVWNGTGFDKTFPITHGYANVIVNAVGTFHAQITAPYAARTLNDFTVTRTYDSVSNAWRCTASPTVQGYAPPDRPATLTLTTPDGTTVTLNQCTAANNCGSNQYTSYMGSTTITLTHGCWCETASTITLPVVFRWRYTISGQNCGLDVWVPACQSVTQISGAGVTLMLCGFAVTAPGTCVLPDVVIIPTPPSGDPFRPNAPCGWLKLNNFDLLIYSSSTTCNPLYWRSGLIPSWIKTRNQCLAPTASSFVWPGGGYITVTA